MLVSFEVLLQLEHSISSEKAYLRCPIPSDEGNREAVSEHVETVVDDSCWTNPSDFADFIKKARETSNSPFGHLK